MLAPKTGAMATVWGGLGPQIQASRTFAPPSPAVGYPPAGAILTKDTMYRQQKYQAAAHVNMASLDVDRQLEQVQTSVVMAHQANMLAKKSVPIARRQKRRCD